MFYNHLKIYDDTSKVSNSFRIPVVTSHISCGYLTLYLVRRVRMYKHCTNKCQIEFNLHVSFGNNWPTTIKQKKLFLRTVSYSLIVSSYLEENIISLKSNRYTFDFNRYLTRPGFTLILDYRPPVYTCVYF